MKKLFTLLLIAITTTSFSQSLKLLYDGVAYNDNDTVTAAIHNLNSENNLYIDLVNQSANDVSVHVRKTEIDILAGTDNNFCYGTECYSGTQSVTPVLILAGDTFSHLNDATAFHLVYSPNLQEGISIIKYTFFNAENESDQASLIFKLDTRPNDISSNTKVVNTITAYPNPATTSINIEYKLNSSYSSNSHLVIKNLMGSILYSKPLSSTEGKVQVDLGNFAPGIYFYSLESNGRTLLTKKLLVK